MNRNILQTMGAIFDNLKDQVQDDDKSRIVNVDRHITPSGDPAPVCEFVKRASEKPVHCASESVCLFSFEDQLYLLLDERFQKTLSEIGFDFEDDEAILQGAGMLAIANKSLPVLHEISSLQVIEQCLGIEPDVGKESVVFQYSEIRDLFTPYCVVRVVDSRFELLYEEDINRLVCYLLIRESTVFDQNSKTRLEKLLLLLSSRSIAGSVLSALQSSLIEYTFLQIYQCVEYFFRLNSCFKVSQMHDISLEKSIDIVLAHEFKTSELENLYWVLRDNASETAIQDFLAILPGRRESDGDEYQIVAKYIYKLRCNVAHLRYKQDDISDVDWERCINALVGIVYSIYRKRDAEIIQVCSSKNSWDLITFS